ncbi:hypothetical protein PVAND_013340 [Polypedilum vanderplanki]|uniref:Uncharacterized protein n=1 Tax=Polypedilum vanderplanki TaxID=319348 RepID=A0A9J6CR86_POLVA|nr:hypothetical protein PVAND_013340 [Polypedilum vanderplanki]
MFFQIKALPRFFREGYFETIEWFGTFIAGILFGIDFGIYTGLLISVIACYINGLQSQAQSEARDDYKWNQIFDYRSWINSNIDLSGYRTIIEIRSEIKLIDVRCYLAKC